GRAARPAHGVRRHGRAGPRLGGPAPEEPAGEDLLPAGGLARGRFLAAHLHSVLATPPAIRGRRLAGEAAGFRYFELLSANHCPMITQPDELAKFLLALV